MHYAVFYEILFPPLQNKEQPAERFITYWIQIYHILLLHSDRRFHLNCSLIKKIFWFYCRKELHTVTFWNSSCSSPINYFLLTQVTTIQGKNPSQCLDDLIPWIGFIFPSLNHLDYQLRLCINMLSFNSTLQYCHSHKNHIYNEIFNNIKNRLQHNDCFICNVSYTETISPKEHASICL